MSISKSLLAKGFKQLLFLIPLFILSPILLTIAFRALKKFTESPQIYIAYAFLVFSILLILFSLYFAFKTFGTILNAFFNKE